MHGSKRWCSKRYIYATHTMKGGNILEEMIFIITLKVTSATNATKLLFVR